MLANRIMCLLSTTFLLTTCNVNTQTPFKATEVVKNNDKTVLNTNKLGLIKTDLEIKLEKDKLEFEKQKTKEAEETLRKEKELEEQKKDEPQWQEFILTFYSSSISENSSAGAVTCQGKKLQPYMIANNVYSLGTQIYLEGYGTKTVADRGSKKHFNTSNRLDVYVEKEPNESYSQYLKRVNGYGIKKVRGYIVK